MLLWETWGILEIKTLRNTLSLFNFSFFFLKKKGSKYFCINTTVTRHKCNTRTVCNCKRACMLLKLHFMCLYRKLQFWQCMLCSEGMPLEENFSILRIKLFKTYWSWFCLTSPGTCQKSTKQRGSELWSENKSHQTNRNKLVGIPFFCLLKATIPYIHINNFKYWFPPPPPKKTNPETSIIS